MVAKVIEKGHAPLRLEIDPHEHNVILALGKERPGYVAVHSVGDAEMLLVERPDEPLSKIVIVVNQ
jgi:hypothetical protein